MSHELSFTETGRAEMAYTGQTPWHRWGTYSEERRTTKEMLALGHMLWEVETEPIYVDRDGVATLVPGFHMVRRKDNLKILSRPVTDKYLCVQNSQCAEMVDALVTQGGAHVETVGALYDGAICWIQTHIPADFDVLRGDTLRPYFLFVWGHDGNHGMAGKTTFTRVVCANTLGAAGFLQGGKWSRVADVYMKHSKKAKIQIDEAHRALGIVKKQVEDTAEAYKLLAARPMSEDQAKEYFEKIFPFMVETVFDTPAEEEAYNLRLARWNDQQAKLLELFEAGRGQEIPGVRGTAWAGYNAVTEWVDHVYPVLASGKRSESREQSVMFGKYSDVRGDALLSALAI